MGSSWVKWLTWIVGSLILIQSVTANDSVVIISDTNTEWLSSSGWQPVALSWVAPIWIAYIGESYQGSSWVWPYNRVDSAEKSGPFQVRRIILLPENAGNITASAQITADNEYSLYVNGEFIGSDTVWSSIETYSIGLHGGENEILINAVNYPNPEDETPYDPDTNPGGLIYRIVYTIVDNTPDIITFDQPEYTDIVDCGNILVTDDRNQVSVKITSRDCEGNFIGEIILDFDETDKINGVFTRKFYFDTDESSISTIQVTNIKRGYITAEILNEPDSAQVSVPYQFYGSLKGRVWEIYTTSSQAPIFRTKAGIDVAVVPEGSSTSYIPGLGELIITTDDEGFFHFDILPQGYYTVIADFESGTGIYESPAYIVSKGESVVTLPSDFEKIRMDKEAAGEKYYSFKAKMDQDYYNFCKIKIFVSPIASLIQYISGVSAGDEFGVWFWNQVIGIINGEIYTDTDKNINGDLFDLLYQATKLRAQEKELENLRDIYFDPADYNYTSVYSLNYTALNLSSDYSGNLTQTDIDLANGLSEMAALDEAILISFERYQGAAISDDFDAAIMQLQALINYCAMMESNRLHLTNTVASKKSEIQAWEVNYSADLESAKSAFFSEEFTSDEIALLYSYNYTDSDIGKLRNLFLNISFSNTLDYLDAIDSLSQSRVNESRSLSANATEMLVLYDNLDNPSIYSISPAIGNQGSAIFITNLTGSKFKPGTVVNLTKTGDSNITMNIDTLTKSKISGTFIIPMDASLGLWNVTVRNPDGQSGILVNGFEIFPVKSADIGLFRPTTHTFYLDSNGNGRWDGGVTDRAFNFGLNGDTPISGDWNSLGKTSIGVFRPSTHTFYLDWNGNGRWDGGVTDRAINFGLNGDTPISGDWNGIGRTCIGVFRPTTHTFYLDWNGNGRWDGGVTDRAFNFGLNGDIPVSGDWNGIGRTCIGVYRPSTRMFYLDWNGNGKWDGGVTDRAYNFGLNGDQPLSGIWN